MTIIIIIITIIIIIIIISKIDTRTKEKLKSEDLRNINSAVEELMKQNSMSPENDPFNYLWMANGVLYAVSVAFLLMKGWKKQRNDIAVTISKTGKEKCVYEEKVKGIRRSISIAKAELERIKENRKITRKGRKNRKELRLKSVRQSRPQPLLTLWKNKKQG